MHFLFEHKLFHVDGARFTLSADAAEPVFLARLGELVVAIPIAAICREFAIEPASPDGRLLNVVAKSLRFLKEIRQGDAIPAELLDGTASWPVEERHRLRAKGRIIAQLIAWTAREEVATADDNSLEALGGHPDARMLVTPAASVLAASGGDGDGSSDALLERIDALAGEQAYLEALRERNAQVRAIVPKLDQLARHVRGNSDMKDDLARIRTLIARPLDELDALFQHFAGGAPPDGSDWLAAYERKIDSLRPTRDALYRRLVEWDPIVALWERVTPRRTAQSEEAVKALYRFLARRYSGQQSW